jgi:hypothetical protein
MLGRVADKGLLVNKLQEALQDIARNIDETAIEYLVGDEAKGETGSDVPNVLPVEDKIEIAQVDNDASSYSDEKEEEEEKNEKVDEIVEQKIETNENENEQIEVVEKIEVQNASLDLDDISSEAIRYNSKGESIENPSALEVKKVACKDDKTLEIKSREENVAENKEIFQQSEDNSSVDEHGQRLWDEHGNSIEQDEDSESEEEEEEAVVVRPVKKRMDLVREKLNKKVGEMRDNQLGMRPMDSDESAFKDDDDIPVITIPMGM